ncbi:MAG TPA: NAD(P)H-quinone oxidoreductase, partial [Alphaproteobacteria bacterium]|nr:NAD(P)H-quinone oxidoreductase [Alphaproteobacteria bacterium]
MRVVAMTEPGGPDVLVPATAPLPEPRSHEVLIRVEAAGVNGPDLVQRRGHYPPPKGASELLGLEVSGVVAALGDDVTQWQKGD